MEAARNFDGVLADHRVDDEVDVVRPNGFLDVTELGHQRFVDREAARGVVDDDVAALRLRFGGRGFADVER